MDRRADAIVIVVCKAPEMGRVKTRLAADIGDVNALRVYSIMMATLFTHLDASDAYDVCACVDGNLDLVQAGNVAAIAQRGDSLGDRMCNAVRDWGDYSKKIVIGSDTPNITSDIIHQAIHALDVADVVIGPSVDGGYYLIGMKQLDESIFDEVPWSTDAVFASTCSKLQAAGRTFRVLPTLRDIDTLEDLQAVMPELLSEH